MPLAVWAAPPLEGLGTLHAPVAAFSGEPCLAVAPDGGVFMSWFERRDSTRHVLKVSRYLRGSWVEPTTVAEGDSFFVNWADFPALVATGGEKLTIAWPWRSGGDTYAYDVRISSTNNGGKTWTPPIVPHRDGTKTEHGFVSLIPAQNGGVRAFWLDGRKFADPAAKAAAHDDGHGGGEMTLRTAWIGPDGSMLDEVEVDDRVCDCCQTSAAGQRGTAVVAYRDRSMGEIRDISIAWLRGGRWSEPAPVHADGWNTPGCPVNGPSLDMDAERLAVAWFTMAGDSAKVLLAFSDDGGRSFARPVRVDGGNPLGRADVELLPDGSALVSWLEKRDQEAAIQVRRVSREGVAGEEQTVGVTAPTRASGFPRMARNGHDVFFAWTQPGETPQVRLAMGRLP